MALADLNVNLKLALNDFDRSIKSVERSLQQTSRKFSEIGNQMSAAFTLPFAALGAASIKAFADFEKLENGMVATMTNAKYSIAEAKKEVENLRNLALLPGLDFEKAVKGSLRLQAVGVSAGEARRVLKEFGNAVVSAGGDAESLDRVTVQLSQMIGKGKIMNDDLRIIKENMPSVSAAMVKAFGTADAEGLRKLNISSAEFVKRLTDEFEKMPRAAGGLSNAIVNAKSAIQQFLVSVGNTIAKTFDLGGASDALASKLKYISGWFAALDPAVREFALKFGLVVIAIGPVAKLIGAISSAGVALTSMLRSLVKDVKDLAGGVVSTIKSLQNMSTAMQALAFGGVIVAVLALKFAFDKLNDGLTEYDRTQKVISDVNRAAAVDTAQQMTRVELLTKVLTDNNAKYDDKKKALEQLKEIGGAYYKSLTVETATTEVLSRANDAYRESILKAATAKAAQSKIEELAAKQADLRVKLTQGFGAGDIIEQGVKSFFGGATALSGAYATLVKSTGDEINELENQKKALTDVVIANNGLNNSLKDSHDAYAKAGRGASELSELQKILIQLNRDLVKESIFSDGGGGFAIKSEAYIKGIKKLIDDGFKPASKEVQLLISKLTELDKGFTAPLPAIGTKNLIPDKIQSDGSSETGNIGGISNADNKKLADLGNSSYKKATDQLNKYGEAAAKVSEAIREFDSGLEGHKKVLSLVEQGYGSMISSATVMKAAIVDAVTAMSTGIENALASSSKSWKDFSSALKSTIKDIIGSLVRVMVAHYMEGLFAKLSFTGPFALPLALAGGALAAGLVKGALGAIGFADGAIVHGPVNALVGEYPGAQSNPEVIAPLDKLRSMIQPGGGVAHVSGEFKIKGTDLVVVLERANQQNLRTRGY